MWNHKYHMEEAVTFLLQNPDGTPADAADFLDTICRTLQSSDQSLSAVAELVYTPLPVYVSLLDDPDAEPASIDDEMEALLDEWPLLHLALVMQHAEAVGAFLAFHQQHAFTVLENSVSESNKAIIAEVMAAHEKATGGGDSAAEEKISLKGFGEYGEQEQQFRECEVRPDLGGMIVIFSGGECGDMKGAETDGADIPQAEGGEGELTSSSLCRKEAVAICSIPWITNALKPFLRCILYERDALAKGEAMERKTKENSLESSLASQLLKKHCSALADFCFRFPSLIVEWDTLYEVCHGDIATFTYIMELHDGLLLPVVHGKRMPSGGYCTSRAASVNATPSDLPHGGNINSSMPRGSCTQQTTVTPFLLTCSAQEHQKLAFLVTWINYREKASIERQPPGSARKNREATVLSEFCVALWNLKKCGQVVPSTSLWSGNLFVLSRLLSRECTIERFLDLVEESDFVSCASGMPITFILALVAGAMVATFFNKPNYMQLLCKKVEVLLVDVPGAPSPLWRYILSEPANHMERFEELWLAETPFSQAKKFQSRVEMMYWALVEEVLCSVEKQLSTSSTLSLSAADDREGMKVQRALQDWLTVCRNFFVSLRDRTISGQHRRLMQLQPSAEGRDAVVETVASASTTSTIKSSTTMGDDTTTDDSSETQVLQCLCEQMRLQIQHGPPPLCRIYASMYPEEAEEAKKRAHVAEDGGGSNNKKDSSSNTTTTTTNSAERIKDDFEAAQVLFSVMLKKVSDSTKLRFYGLYKQATIGDINISKPWMMDPVGCAKWDAWNANKGMSSYDAMQRYVLELRTLQKS